MKINSKQNKLVYAIIIVVVLLVISIWGFLVGYSKDILNDMNELKQSVADDIINENNKFNITEENEVIIKNDNDIEIIEDKEENKFVEYSGNNEFVEKTDELEILENNEISKESDVIYKSERIEKVKNIKEINSDIVGWLEIPNTNISYPIVQGKDNDYYMRRNYKKKYTINGSLFLDKEYDWYKPSDNLLIYGHNNRGTNEMFVELLKYKDESFYKKHPIVRFTTKNEDAIYEIISVFESRVYYKRENDVFRYYYFIEADTKEDFDYYVSESKKASLYNIDKTAEYGDQLITLSTCDYTQKDGRFVVVARKKQ